MYINILAITHNQQRGEVRQYVTEAGHPAANADSGLGQTVTGGAEGDQVLELVGSLPAGETSEGLDMVNMQGLVRAGRTANLAAFAVSIQYLLPDIVPVRAVIVLVGVPKHLILQFGDRCFINGYPVAKRCSGNSGGGLPYRCPGSHG